MQKVNADVLILGGGVAGLAALKSLRDNGITDYLLVEGGCRLGGRVHSVKSEDGLILEYGAGWIHGGESFPLHDHAVDSEFKLRKTNYNQASCRNKQGRDVTNDVISAYYKLAKLSEETFDYAGSLKSNAEEPDIPYDQALAKSGWVARTPEEKCAEYLIYDFFYGMDTTKISTRFSFEYDPEDPESFDYRVADTSYAKLIESFCEVEDLNDPEDPKIFLNQVVTDVICVDEGVIVKTNDTIFTAKYAIMTFSLGVMKSDVVRFTPPLPFSKRETFRELTMLNYMKVFVRYADDVKPFWDDSEMLAYCSARKHYFTIWENLKVLGANVLVGTLMDDEADAALLWSPEELEENVMEVLRNMYGDNIPQPKWIKTTTWMTDPLFQGAFSGRPVGITFKDIENLRAPIGGLHFAGEAYSNDHYGDVYGAYQTGQEEGATVACALRREI